MNLPLHKRVILLVLILAAGISISAVMKMRAFGLFTPAAKIVVATSFSEDEKDAIGYKKAFADFEKKHNVEIVLEPIYTGFVTEIMASVKRGEVPDVGFFAQPSLYRALAHAGALQALDPVSLKQLEQNVPPAELDLTRVDGVSYGVWGRYALKSLVWYRRDFFAKHALKPPADWFELLELERKIHDLGMTPWCVALEAGDSTGWAATDWVEEYLLRFAPVREYDDLIRDDLYTSVPGLLNAMTAYQKFINSDLIYGGVQHALRTPVERGGDPMFEDPPGCALMRMSDWIYAEFPEWATKPGEELVDYFLLPSVYPSSARALLVAGDIVAAFNKRPVVRAFVEYLGSEEYAYKRIEAGNYFSPLRQIIADRYPKGSLARRLKHSLDEANVVRFDASDVMPDQVGNRAYWELMKRLTQGESPEIIATELERLRREAFQARTMRPDP